MKIKKIWANLPVADTYRTAEFYTALGIKPNITKVTPDLASFLFGEDDFVIHFFRKDKLEQSMNDKAITPKSGSEVMFSLSAQSENEVAEWAEKAEEAGGPIIKKPGRQADGFYYCVFADLDGHKFNVLLIEKGM